MGRPAMDQKFTDLVKVMDVHECALFPLNGIDQRQRRNSLVAVERVTGHKYRSVAHNDGLYVIRVE